MRQAIPWTIGLLLTTTMLAFVIGTLLGALLAWPRSPRCIHYLFPPLLTLSAIPFFLLGLLLIYLFAFRLQWFPLFGGYTPGTFPAWNVELRPGRPSTLGPARASPSCSPRSVSGRSACAA